MKQQQLLFDKGITYVPSDVLCSDNALSECVGMTYENGEMKPIQNPSALFTAATGVSQIPYILYLHKYNDETRYVGYIQTGSNPDTFKMVWGIKSDTTFVYQGDIHDSTSNQTALAYDKTDKTITITSVGKILIYSSKNGILYHLWTNSGGSDVYDCLGGAIPRPEVDFRLINRGTTSAKGSMNVPAPDVLAWDTSGDVGCWGITIGKQEEWNNFVVGLYSKLKKEIAQKKAFHGSFCIRYAIELYDGSYYHISNPILMLNQFSAYGVAGLRGLAMADSVKVTMRIHGQELQYKFNGDYSKWADLIKNIVVFVTDEADLVDTRMDALCTLGTSIDTTNTIPLAYYMSGRQYQGNDIVEIGKDLTNLGETDTTDIGVLYQVLASTPDSDLIATIKNGVYYKLCEIGTSGNATWHNASDLFDVHTLETITTQTQLGVDDYFSDSQITADMLYSYNSRLNLSGVKRELFDGFDYFMPFDTPFGGSTNTSSTYTFYVTIRTDTGDITVAHEKSTKQIQGIYFYYPDPRAKRLVIKKGNNYILDVELTEHPTLNGAYYFAGVSYSMTEPSQTVSSPPSVSSSKVETLPNYILTSEVNNPFVFRPQGYYKVGTGKIIGMSTITQALSEGQFGQFPLLVFSESGIWALTVGSTGYYTSINPISREVCSNAKSITQTDGAVYFVSKKGLMVVIGSNVKCVSEQLDGRVYDNSSPLNFVISPNFKGFLDRCMIAYDYRESQLILIDPEQQQGRGFQWVYNIKSGTFSKARLLGTSKITNIVNAYPDNLLQGVIPVVDGNTTSEVFMVYSLLGKPDQNSDTYDSYSGTILTRPMKLENGLALKTIMDLENIRFFHQDTYTETEGQTTVTKNCLVLKIYGSNNCKNWLEVPSLTGVPWKYYRFKFEFNKLKASDRFAGTVLVTQERRTNQLR